MKYINKTLASLGLSDNEIKIYLEALKHDEVTPFELAKLTGIARTTVYDTISDLALKDLVTKIENKSWQKKQTKIKAKNPSSIRAGIRKKRKELLKQEANLLAILPGLKRSYFKQNTDTNFQYFPGIKGAKKVYFDKKLARIDLPSYIWTNLMPMDNFGGKEIDDDMTEILNINAKLSNTPKKLISLNDWTKHVLTYQYGRDNRYIVNNEIRIIDNPLFDPTMRIIIKGEVIRMITTSEEESWGAIINSKSLAHTLESMFQLQWIGAKVVDKEFVERLGVNEFTRHINT